MEPSPAHSSRAAEESAHDSLLPSVSHLEEDTTDREQREATSRACEVGVSYVLKKLKKQKRFYRI